MVKIEASRKEGEKFVLAGAGGGDLLGVFIHCH